MPYRLRCVIPDYGFPLARDGWVLDVRIEEIAGPDRFLLRMRPGEGLLGKLGRAPGPRGDVFFGRGSDVALLLEGSPGVAGLPPGTGSLHLILPGDTLLLWEEDGCPIPTG